MRSSWGSWSAVNERAAWRRRQGETTPRIADLEQATVRPSSPTVAISSRRRLATGLNSVSLSAFACLFLEG